MIDWKPLTERFDDYAARFGGTLGVSARHLDTGKEAHYNAEEIFPTASMIKIGILIELYRQHDAGRLSIQEPLTLAVDVQTKGSGVLVDMTPGRTVLTLRDTAFLMMALSDNTATNQLIARLGQDSINALLRGVGGMTRTVLNNPIDFARIAEQGNEALAVGSPRDFVELLTRLWRRELLTPESTADALKIMRNQKYISAMGRYLPYDPYDEEFGEPATLWIASKSGGLTGVRCQAGLFGTPGGVYALCVMGKDIEDRTSGIDNEGSRAISDLSKIVYETWGNRQE